MSGWKGLIGTTPVSSKISRINTVTHMKEISLASRLNFRFSKSVWLYRSNPGGTSSELAILCLHGRMTSPFTSTGYRSSRENCAGARLYELTPNSQLTQADMWVGDPGSVILCDRMNSKATHPITPICCRRYTINTHRAIIRLPNASHLDLRSLESALLKLLPEYR